tara:strand:+ start:34 stop:2712 length:2679 start_codon:yes stop_codon:yes gene_type:complete
MSLELSILQRLLQEAIISQSEFLDKVSQTYTDRERLPDDKILAKLLELIDETQILSLTGKANKKSRKKVENFIDDQVKAMTAEDGSSISIRDIRKLYDGIIKYLTTKADVSFDVCIKYSGYFLNNIYSILSSEERLVVDAGDYPFEKVFSSVIEHKYFTQEATRSEYRVEEVYEDDKIKIVYPQDGNSFNKYLRSILNIEQRSKMGWCTQSVPTWTKYTAKGTPQALFIAYNKNYKNTLHPFSAISLKLNYTYNKDGKNNDPIRYDDSCDFKNNHMNENSLREAGFSKEAEKACIDYLEKVYEYRQSRVEGLKKDFLASVKLKKVDNLVANIIEATLEHNEEKLYLELFKNIKDTEFLSEVLCELISFDVDFYGQEFLMAKPEDENNIKTLKDYLLKITFGIRFEDTRLKKLIVNKIKEKSFKKSNDSKYGSQVINKKIKCSSEEFIKVVESATHTNNSSWRSLYSQIMKYINSYETLAKDDDFIRKVFKVIFKSKLYTICITELKRFDIVVIYDKFSHALTRNDGEEETYAKINKIAKEEFILFYNNIEKNMKIAGASEHFHKKETIDGILIENIRDDLYASIGLNFDKKRNITFEEIESFISAFIENSIINFKFDFFHFFEFCFTKLIDRMYSFEGYEGPRIKNETSFFVLIELIKKGKYDGLIKRFAHLDVKEIISETIIAGIKFSFFNGFYNIDNSDISKAASLFIANLSSSDKLEISTFLLKSIILFIKNERSHKVFNSLVLSSNENLTEEFNDILEHFIGSIRNYKEIIIKDYFNDKSNQHEYFTKQTKLFSLQDTGQTGNFSIDLDEKTFTKQIEHIKNNVNYKSFLDAIKDELSYADKHLNLDDEDTKEKASIIKKTLKDKLGIDVFNSLDYGLLRRTIRSYLN